MIDYYKVNATSNSRLGWFSKGPLYYDMMMKEEDHEDAPHQLLGRLFHCMVLEADKVEQRFAVFPDKPQGMMGQFIEFIAMYNTQPIIEQELYEAAQKEVGFKQDLSTSIKAFNKEENQKYYRALIASRGKKLVSPLDWNIATIMAKAVKEHIHAQNLLNPKGGLSYKEFPIYWKRPDCSLELKSLLDCVVIDLDKRTAIIPDLKHTSKPIIEYPWEYKKYSVYRQMAFYTDALFNYLFSTYGEVFDIRCYIIAVESNKPNQVECYDIDLHDIEVGRKEYLKLLYELEWHMENGLWMPRHYYSSPGTVKLNMFKHKLEEV